MAKILLFVPTYRGEDGQTALHPRTFASLCNLDFGDHAVTTWISVDEQPDRRENIFRQYQKAWQTARDEKYDALLTIEHDMVIPPDALVKLAGVDAEIVYGVYLFRETATLNAMYQGTDVFLDGSLDNWPDDRRAAFAAAGAWPVSGAGMGCTLFRRSVIEQFDLRRPFGGGFPDLPLAYDAYHAGIKQAAHFGVLCGHICPDGYELWPDADQVTALNYTLPCQLLTDFRGYENWRHTGRPGDVIEVPGKYAGKLAFMGNLKILPRKEMSNGTNHPGD